MADFDAQVADAEAARKMREEERQRQKSAQKQKIDRSKDKKALGKNQEAVNEFTAAEAAKASKDAQKDAARAEMRAKLREKRAKKGEVPAEPKSGWDGGFSKTPRKQADSIDNVNPTTPGRGDVTKRLDMDLDSADVSEDDVSVESDAPVEYDALYAEVEEAEAAVRKERELARQKQRLAMQERKLAKEKKQNSQNISYSVIEEHERDHANVEAARANDRDAQKRRMKERIQKKREEKSKAAASSSPELQVEEVDDDVARLQAEIQAIEAQLVDDNASNASDSSEPVSDDPGFTLRGLGEDAERLLSDLDNDARAVQEQKKAARDAQQEALRRKKMKKQDKALKKQLVDDSFGAELADSLAEQRALMGSRSGERDRQKLANEEKIREKKKKKKNTKAAEQPTDAAAATPVPFERESTQAALDDILGDIDDITRLKEDLERSEKEVAEIRKKAELDLNSAASSAMSQHEREMKMLEVELEINKRNADIDAKRKRMERKTRRLKKQAEMNNDTLAQRKVKEALLNNYETDLDALVATLDSEQDKQRGKVGSRLADRKMRKQKTGWGESASNLEPDSSAAPSEDDAILSIVEDFADEVKETNQLQTNVDNLADEIKALENEMLSIQGAAGKAFSQQEAEMRSLEVGLELDKRQQELATAKKRLERKQRNLKKQALQLQNFTNSEIVAEKLMDEHHISLDALDHVLSSEEQRQKNALAAKKEARKKRRESMNMTTTPEQVDVLASDLVTEVEECAEIKHDLLTMQDELHELEQRATETFDVAQAAGRAIDRNQWEMDRLEAELELAKKKSDIDLQRRRLARRQAKLQKMSAELQDGAERDGVREKLIADHGVDLEDLSRAVADEAKRQHDSLASRLERRKSNRGDKKAVSDDVIVRVDEIAQEVASCGAMKADLLDMQKEAKALEKRATESFDAAAAAGRAIDRNQWEMDRLEAELAFAKKKQEIELHRRRLERKEARLHKLSKENMAGLDGERIREMLYKDHGVSMENLEESIRAEAARQGLSLKARLSSRKERQKAPTLASGSEDLVVKVEELAADVAATAEIQATVNDLEAQVKELEVYATESFDAAAAAGRAIDRNKWEMDRLEAELELAKKKQTLELHRKKLERRQQRLKKLAEDNASGIEGAKIRAKLIDQHGIDIDHLENAVETEAARQKNSLSVRLQQRKNARTQGYSDDTVLKAEEISREVEETADMANMVALLEKEAEELKTRINEPFDIAQAAGRAIDRNQWEMDKLEAELLLSKKLQDIEVARKRLERKHERLRRLAKDGTADRDGDKLRELLFDGHKVDLDNLTDAVRSEQDRQKAVLAAKLEKRSKKAAAGSVEALAEEIAQDVNEAAEMEFELSVLQKEIKKLERKVNEPYDPSKAAHRAIDRNTWERERLEAEYELNKKRQEMELLRKKLERKNAKLQKLVQSNAVGLEGQRLRELLYNQHGIDLGNLEKSIQAEMDRQKSNFQARLDKRRGAKKPATLESLAQEISDDVNEVASTRNEVRDLEESIRKLEQAQADLEDEEDPTDSAEAAKRRHERELRALEIQLELEKKRQLLDMARRRLKRKEEKLRALAAGGKDDLERQKLRDLLYDQHQIDLDNLGHAVRAEQDRQRDSLAERLATRRELRKRKGTDEAVIMAPDGSVLVEDEDEYEIMARIASLENEINNYNNDADQKIKESQGDIDALERALDIERKRQMLALEKKKLQLKQDRLRRRSEGMGLDLARQRMIKASESEIAALDASLLSERDRQRLALQKKILEKQQKKKLSAQEKADLAKLEAELQRLNAEDNEFAMIAEIEALEQEIDKFDPNAMYDEHGRHLTAIEANLLLEQKRQELELMRRRLARKQARIRGNEDHLRKERLFDEHGREIDTLSSALDAERRQQLEAAKARLRDKRSRPMMSRDKAEIAALEKEIQQLELQEVEQLRSVVANLEKEVADYDNDIARLRREQEGDASALERKMEMERKRQLLELQRKKLRRKEARLRGGFEYAVLSILYDEHGNQVRTLEDALISERERQMFDLQNRINNRKKKKVISPKESEELERWGAELAAMGSADDLELDAAIERLEIEAMNAEVQRMQAQLDAYDADPDKYLRDHQGDLTRLEMQLLMERQRQELDRKRKHMERLKRKLRGGNDMLTRERLFDEHGREILGLEGQYMSERERQMEAMKRRIEARRRQLAEGGAPTQEQLAKVEEMEQELQRLQQADMAEIQAAIDQLQNKIDSFDPSRLYDEHGRQLTAIEAQLLLEKYRQELDLLKRIGDRKLGRRNRNRDQMEGARLMDEHEKDIGRVETQYMSEREKQLDSMRKRLDAKRARAKQLGKSEEDMAADPEIGALEREIMTLMHAEKDELDELQAKVDKLENDIAKFDPKYLYDEHGRAITALERQMELDRMKQMLETEKKRLMRKQQRLKDAEAANADLLARNRAYDENSEAIGKLDKQYRSERDKQLDALQKRLEQRKSKKNITNIDQAEIVAMYAEMNRLMDEEMDEVEAIRSELERIEEALADPSKYLSSLGRDLSDLERNLEMEKLRQRQKTLQKQLERKEERLKQQLKKLEDDLNRDKLYEAHNKDLKALNDRLAAEREEQLGIMSRRLAGRKKKSLPAKKGFQKVMAAADAISGAAGFHHKKSWGNHPKNFERLFDMLDKRATGTLQPEVLQDYHEKAHFCQIPLGHVKVSMKKICLKGDRVRKKEFVDLCYELTQRCQLRKQFQWDFNIMTRHSNGVLRRNQAKMFFMQARGARFDVGEFNRFMQKQGDKAITFEDIEYLLIDGEVVY